MTLDRLFQRCLTIQACFRHSTVRVGLLVLIVALFSTQQVFAQTVRVRQDRNGNVRITGDSKTSAIRLITEMGVTKVDAATFDTTVIGGDALDPINDVFINLRGGNDEVAVIDVEIAGDLRIADSGGATRTFLSGIDVKGDLIVDSDSFARNNFFGHSTSLRSCFVGGNLLVEHGRVEVTEIEGKGFVCASCIAMRDTTVKGNAEITHFGATARGGRFVVGIDNYISSSTIGRHLTISNGASSATAQDVGLQGPDSTAIGTKNVLTLNCLVEGNVSIYNFRNFASHQASTIGAVKGTENRIEESVFASDFDLTSIVASGSGDVDEIYGNEILFQGNEILGALDIHNVRGVAAASEMSELMMASPTSMAVGNDVVLDDNSIGQDVRITNNFGEALAATACGTFVEFPQLLGNEIGGGVQVTNGTGIATAFSGDAKGNKVDFIFPGTTVVGDVEITNGFANARNYGNGDARSNSISVTPFQGEIRGPMSLRNGDCRANTNNGDAVGNVISVRFATNSVMARNGNAIVNASGQRADGNGNSISIRSDAGTNSAERVIDASNAYANATSIGENADANANVVSIVFDPTGLINANVTVKNGNARALGRGEFADANGNDTSIGRGTVVGNIDATNGFANTAGDGRSFGNGVRISDLSLTGNTKIKNGGARSVGDDPRDFGGITTANEVIIDRRVYLHGSLDIDQGSGYAERNNFAPGPIAGIQTLFFADALIDGDVNIKVGSGTAIAGDFAAASGILFSTFGRGGRPFEITGDLIVDEGVGSLRAGQSSAGADSLHSLNRLVVGGLFSVTSRGGENEIYFDECEMNDVDLRLTSGNDLFSPRDSSVDGFAIYDGGSGDDEFSDDGSNTFANGIETIRVENP